MINEYLRFHEGKSCVQNCAPVHHLCQPGLVEGDIGYQICLRQAQADNILND
jgi:hypothetical protein